MSRARGLIAGLLNLTALLTLLVVAVAVPMVAYFQSPWWFLKEVGPTVSATFFVALGPERDAKPDQIRVVAFDPRKKEFLNAQYHLPDGRMSYSWGPGEGNASIYSTTEAQGSQLIRVFVAGDTPWTSLSEYRVAQGRIYPLRHSHSESWLLLGIPVLLVLFSLLRKPMERSIKRFVGAESE